MKVAIVGYGYVGKAMFEFFKSKYDTIFYDPYLSDSCTKDQVNERELAVICCPTNEREDGSCDTRIVEEVIDWIESELILIKSTVAVGTTKRLKEKTGKRIVFSPEYIGESDYCTDKYDFNKFVVRTPFFTFGGDKEDTQRMVEIATPIGGPMKRYVQTDSTSAEIAKYMENTFFATKLVFCYEFAEIARANGCDFNEVRELWLLDPRINRSHTSVFATNTEPYSGKCLPKDTKAIVTDSDGKGYSANLLKEVIASNRRIGEQRENRQ